MDRVKTSSENGLMLQEAPNGRTALPHQDPFKFPLQIYEVFFCHVLVSRLVYSRQKIKVVSGSNVHTDVLKNSLKNETRMRMIRCVRG